MSNIIEKIGEGIFSINFWWQYERPIRKSMRRVRNYMNEAIESLENVLNNTSPENGEGAPETQDTYEDDEYYDNLKTSMVEMYGKYTDEVRRTHEVKATIDRIDKIIVELEDTEVNSEGCETMEQFQTCIRKGQEKIVLTGAMYKLWKYYMRAATKRTISQTVNVSGDWNVTFGYGEDMVVLSTPYRGKNTIGVYRVELKPSKKNIIFTRIK